MPRLWRDLDLSQARRQVKPSFINKCFSHSRHTIEKAWIDRVASPDPVIAALTRKCNSLSSLTIVSTDRKLTGATLQELLFATNLSNLSLFSPKLRQEDARRVLQGCRNLVSFNCTGLLSARDSDTWECIPRSLQHLRLEVDNGSRGNPYFLHIVSQF